jgi:two-component system phosphate regulon sensor histidine kinase PhoR
MHRRTFGFRIFGILVSVSAAAIAAMALGSALAMRRLQTDSTLAALGQAAAAFANVAPIPGDPVPGDPALGDPLDATDAFCRRMAAGTRLRISVIAIDGRVLGDSGSDYGAMDNHAGRPEIVAALRGEIATSLRRSPTLGLVMAYAAAPVRADGVVSGVVRVAMSAPELRAGLVPFIVASALIAAATIAAMATLSARIGAGIAEPMRALTAAAAEWSAGRLERRVRRFEDPELGPLADTMNAMAAELAGRIVAMERQKGELGAILDGMGEAVLSTDADLVIRLANPKARALLARPGDRRGLEGRSVLQAAGSIDLEGMARRCAAGGAREEAEIALYGEETRYLLTSASSLPLEGGRSGAVIVLNDITRLKRLERVRKDFVANVSHELRTPITLIKGFAETLEEVDDPAEARRFLGIVKRHADRMASIVDDLLTLAQLENPERGRLETAPVDAGFVLARAIESLGDRPEEKGVAIRVGSEPGLVVDANEGLLEQALVNLLDNAVKYGPSGGSIRLEASKITENGIESAMFSVADEGPGIPAKDLSRLFERFYRVDRARSRELGGTGLGLAIVRHIALAHGGDASAESREGFGSIFSITIPLRADSALDSVHAATPDGETRNS